MNISSHIDTIMKGIKMVQKDPNLEMEAIYNTNIDYPIEKETFNRVISYLKGYNEATFHASSSTMDIFIPEEDNSLRYTIFGDGAIHSYCKSNNLSTLKAGSYILQRKTRQMKPVDIGNYNIRINFKKELDEKIDMEIFNKWPTINKMFRYKKRFSFKTNDKLFSIDCSIIKSSNTKINMNPSTYIKKKDIKPSMKKFILKPKNVMDFEAWFETLKPSDDVELRGKKYEEMILAKNIQTSNVLRNEVKYEIEIEYLGNKIGYKEKYEKILELFKGHIEFLLKAIQNNTFIISQEEKSRFKKEYQTLLKSKRFMGPQPTALEMKHVTRKDYSDYNDILSIRRNYCVTDKADGERNLMVVLENGDVYMMNRKSEIKSLGCNISNMANSVLDGEYIVKDSKNQPIIMFMVFDIYIYKHQDLRNEVFNRSEEQKQIGDLKTSRYEKLNEFFDKMEMIKETDGLILAPKKFYFGDVVEYDEDTDKEIMRLETELKAFSEDEPRHRDLVNYINKLKSDTLIFEHSKMALDKKYVYSTDGLIFTPINLPVGGSFGSKNSKFDGRWFSCFKWKPPLETTIDFRIKFKKDPEDSTKDLISYFKDGDNVIQYKTAVLYVGYNAEIHSSVNSCRVLNEELTFESGYNNVPFHPYNPYIRNIEFAYLRLNNDVAYTDHKQIISEDNIVEFRYNKDKEEGFWWEPMRVRNVNNPNDFVTAINNWRTLHNPILDNMIKSGNTPNVDDVYYIKTKERKDLPTKSLGDFHSYVKKSLIGMVSKGAKNYLDICSGKCGDMNHWLDTKLENIVCMDINRDNLENKENGACNRVLNAMKDENKNKPMLRNTLMVWGNAAYNMENGNAANDDLNKYYLDVLYGNIEQSLIENSKLQRMYGLLKDNRFDVVSCQFSIHYFFENKVKLNGFLENISSNLNVGGKFIGTTLNGQKVFDALKTSEVILGETYDSILWKIKKKYTNEEFRNDESSISMPIDVYINSIGKTTTEWLVNFKYLEEQAMNYNLELKTLGEFEDMYKKLESSKTKYGDASSMSDPLKELSYLYNYFIFEKI